MPNMSANKWGPAFWFTLHATAFGYPTEPTKEDISKYKNFYNSLADVIPCSVCRKHFNEMINKDFKLTDEILKNREALIKWTYDIHDYVNVHKKITVGWMRKQSPPYGIFYKYYNSLLV